MIYITAIHLEGGSQHEHIAQVRWKNTANNKTATSSKAEIIDFIANKNGSVFVTDGQDTVQVVVVKTNPPYFRTYADGKWKDNLLALPRY